MSNTPLLERIGVDYFRARSRSVKVVDVDGVHYLNPEERAGLKRTQRSAIRRAAAAGALSTIASASAEILAAPLLGTNPDAAATWETTARFGAVVVGATIVASFFEILFLYWDGLRAVHELAVVAGLELFPAEQGGEQTAVAAAMARAALELPNPAGTIFGVNPRRDASRLRLLAASALYKLKISVTNFLLKALVRRMLGRALVRAWLPFVAVPVTAAWNGIVAWLVMREARIRAMGPSAAREMLGLALAKHADLSHEGRRAAVRAVASSIVRTEDMHPNLHALLVDVVARMELGSDPDRDLDDPARFLAIVRGLAAGEQTAVLRVLAIAAVIDGRVTAAEKELLREAHAACGRELDLHRLDLLRRGFVRGDALDAELL